MGRKLDITSLIMVVIGRTRNKHPEMPRLEESQDLIAYANYQQETANGEKWLVVKKNRP